jgi:hypothetical protein
LIDQFIPNSGGIFLAVGNKLECISTGAYIGHSSSNAELGYGGKGGNGGHGAGGIGSIGGVGISGGGGGGRCTLDSRMYGGNGGIYVGGSANNVGGAVGGAGGGAGGCGGGGASGQNGNGNGGGKPDGSGGILSNLYFGAFLYNTNSGGKTRDNGYEGLANLSPIDNVIIISKILKLEKTLLKLGGLNGNNGTGYSWYGGGGSAGGNNGLAFISCEQF